MCKIKTTDSQMDDLQQELFDCKKHSDAEWEIQFFPKTQRGKRYLEIIVNSNDFFLLGIWNTYSYQKNRKLLAVAIEYCRTLDIAKANKKLEEILRND